MRVLKIKNGANGTSVFIPTFLDEINIYRSPTTDPIQKDNIIADRPRYIPNTQPRPSISLASPNPIHFPFDNTHSSANGRASRGPAIKYDIDGIINKEPKPE